MLSVVAIHRHLGQDGPHGGSTDHHPNCLPTVAHIPKCYAPNPSGIVRAEQEGQSCVLALVPQVTDIHLCLLTLGPSYSLSEHNQERLDMALVALQY